MRGTGNPLAQTLLWHLRRDRTGHHGDGRRDNDDRPPDAGQRSGGGPIDQHGGNRPMGRHLQRELGLLSVRGFGGVGHRRGVHCRQVLDIGVEGQEWQRR